MYALIVTIITAAVALLTATIITSSKRVVPTPIVYGVSVTVAFAVGALLTLLQ